VITVTAGTAIHLFIGQLFLLVVAKESDEEMFKMEVGASSAGYKWLVRVW
jgi:hypothetical protein